jgi:plastocyanin
MKKLVPLLALALAALALVACGSDDDDSATSGGGETTSEATTGGGGDKAGGGGAAGGATLSFEADPNGGLAYTSTEETAKAGKTTIEFNNPQPLTHDVVIEDSSGEDVAETELIAEAEDSTTANLKPGTYTFYCSVPGHREAGMEGTLTVK